MTRPKNQQQKSFISAEKQVQNLPKHINLDTNLKPYTDEQLKLRIEEDEITINILRIELHLRKTKRTGKQKPLTDFINE